MQDAVNKAIRERDGQCINSDGSCCGRLEASLFRERREGLVEHADSASKHHISPPPAEPALLRPMDAGKLPGELEWMETARKRVVKYSQPVLRDILDMARRGALDELTEYIRALIVNG